MNESFFRNKCISRKKNLKERDGHAFMNLLGLCYFLNFDINIRIIATIGFSR